jgi:hypothetical protein
MYNNRAMIILSVGMPRAGSGWYYNLTNDLALASGLQDARVVRKKYHLESILTEVNCNIGALTPRRLLMVSLPSLLGNSFVIKAHAGPTPMARRMIALGQLRPAYIYRDPRDAMLSAYENGQRALEKGRPNAFSHLVDFDTSLDFILEYVNISRAWMQVPQALHTRYESLVGDYDTEVARILKFFAIEGSSPEIRAVIEKYRPQAARTEQKGLHFSQGKRGRFRQKYTEEQQAIMIEKMGDYLEEMGYDI